MKKSAEKKEKHNILFAAFEAVPFTKTGGLGDVAGTLPGYINSSEFEVRVILPKVRQIPAGYAEKIQHLCEFSVPLGWRNAYCGLEVLRLGRVTYYFIDNKYYFDREKLYGEFDDGERTAFFSKAILESVLHMKDFMPDIIHCNDWHTALVPVFLREQYMSVPGFDRIKTVFTIHNLKFQGQYSRFVFDDVCGLAGTPAEHQMCLDESVNFLAGAVKYSDFVTTVSPSYAKEICTEYYGENLQKLFIEKNNRLIGIVNGIDTRELDPEKDKNLKANYSADNTEGKKVCKEALQKELGLEVNPDVPLFAVVSRLTEQKGMDLINLCLPMFEGQGMQLAVLGTGDRQFEDSLKCFSEKNPRSIAARLSFDEALSRRIYAGADAFLMPSRFEPCGLSQLMAMRYGCLPIVRETGGLKDTVEPYNMYTGEGTGFSFANYDASELAAKIKEASGLYLNYPEVWNRLMVQAMSKDFSWKKSALQYRKLYRQLL